MRNIRKMQLKNQKAQPKSKRAFTIVEISLAMTFLAILLVGIATLIIRTMNIYQKGVTLRAVNTMGTEIIDDITRTISQSPSIISYALADSDGDGSINFKEQRAARNLYYRSRYSGEHQMTGAFCTGRYTYVWNTAYTRDETYEAGSGEADADRHNSKATVITDGVSTMTPRLARVFDPSQAICQEASAVEQWEGSDPIVLSVHVPAGKELSEYANELIRRDESNLWLYEFNLNPIIQSPIINQSFVSATFILATEQGGVNIESNGDYCRGNGNGDSNTEFDRTGFNYCAVNKFSFSARSGGMGN